MLHRRDNPLASAWDEVPVSQFSNSSLITVTTGLPKLPIMLFYMILCAFNAVELYVSRIIGIYHRKAPNHHVF